MGQDQYKRPELPAAKEARNRMYASSDEEQRSAARQLLRVILGAGPDETRMEPIPWNWFWDGPGDARDRGQYERVTPLAFGETLPERLQDIYSFTAQQYPMAGRNVSSVLGHDDKAGNGVLGTYNRFWGAMTLRPTLDGQERSDQDIKRTILHELSHAMGTPDTFTMGQPTEPVGAYDISSAAETLAPRDINLPLEGEALKRAMATKKKK